MLQGWVASVCQVGRPVASQEGTSEVPAPSGSVEVQQGRSGESGGGAVAAHRSERVPRLSREKP